MGYDTRVSLCLCLGLMVTSPNFKDFSSIFLSASSADMRARTPVPLFWLGGGRDDYGGARRHTSLPFHRLQQQSQPRGHSKGKVRSLTRYIHTFGYVLHFAFFIVDFFIDEQVQLGLRHSHNVHRHA